MPRALLGVVMLAGACGDPAVDGGYEGEARFELNGLVCATGKLPSATTAIGIMWTTIAPDATRLDSLAGEVQDIDTRALPVNFGMNLFEMPPAGFATPIHSGIG